MLFVFGRNMPCLLKEVGDGKCCVRSPDVCPADVRAVSGILVHSQDTSLLSGRISSRAMFRSLRLFFQDSCLFFLFVYFKLIFVEAQIIISIQIMNSAKAKHLCNYHLNQELCLRGPSSPSVHSHVHHHPLILPF